MKTLIPPLVLSVADLNGDAADAVFQEKGGVILIEAESTGSRLGEWKKKKDVKDFGGDCHLEFIGNKTENGPPKSPLKYRFKVSKAGNHTLSIRARKRLESKRADISNDCYVAMKGDFSAGGEAPRDVLKSDTKMYGGNADGWGWTRNLDKHKKFPAIYRFKSGEIYEFTISGRSKNFNIDRFIFVHESENLRDVQKRNPPESRADTGGSRPVERVRRPLTNKDGRSIEAELLRKDGDTLGILVRGRLHEIEISTLSKEDQKFIASWEP